MKCSRCQGKLFIDRVYTDNKNFEVYCIICGGRAFVSKSSKLGKVLSDVESIMNKELMIGLQE